MSDYPIDKVNGIVAAYAKDPNRDVKFAELIVSLEEQNKLLLEANTRGANVENLLRAEVDRLREDAAMAYQVVGTLGYYLQIDDDHILDNLSAASNGIPRPHENVLPYPKSDPPLIVKMRGIMKLTEEATKAIDAGEVPKDGWHGWKGRVIEAVFVLRDWFERGGK